MSGRNGWTLLLAIMIAFCGSAGIGSAQTVADSVVDELSRQNYSKIEVSRTWLGRIRVTASDGTAGDREIIINPSTGAILRDYTARDGSRDDVRGRPSVGVVGSQRDKPGRNEAGREKSGRDGGDPSPAGDRPEPSSRSDSSGRSDRAGSPGRSDPSDRPDAPGRDRPDRPDQSGPPGKE